jgi:hypothetical protein
VSKPIEDNDNAKEFLENLASASPLTEAAKIGLAALLGMPSYSTLTAANAAEEHNVVFYNTTLQRFQTTTA